MNDSNCTGASTRDDDGIATLTIDRPGGSANTLASAVLLELEAAAGRARARAAARR